MTIDDPVFGMLEYRDGWIGQIEVPFLEQSFELTINNSLEFPPEDDERQTWRTFLDRQTQFKQSVPRAIMNWYLENLERIRDWYTPEEQAEFAPDVTLPEQMSELVRPLRSVWFELGHDDQTTAISIEFWCKWDDEHGLSLTFYGNQIGVSEGGAHWLDNTRYNLEGRPVDDSNQQ